MIRFLHVLLLLLFTNNLLAQPPKREFRAAWIATVANIDWPSKPGLAAEQQQQEFIARLNQLQKLGCNAVIVQIRPACDALYDSKIEPWSRYLTGGQGKPPFPYYDPLEFMIEEAHKRNMEFHAWFNPFRALTSSKYNPNPPDHVTKKHPDWVINYGGKSYLDPGLPQAREYVLSVIMDVVKRYNIDAVHLDDYFYPYRIAGQEFGDQKSYARYGNKMARDDWRRNNVSLFVSLLNTNIKSEKPYLKFGISPFGVWRNASKDPEGSPTRGGQTNYDDLFADVLLWMRKGWIDYLLPQLYWEHKHRLVAFDVLFPWWDAHSYDRHMYYGLGVYRMVDAKKGPWVGTGELMWQLRDIRRDALTKGYAFYSSSSFDKVGRAISDSIAAFNEHYAFPPEMKWLDSVPPAQPVLTIQSTPKETRLTWKIENPYKEPLRFAVYRFYDDEPVDLTDPRRIVSVQTGTTYIATAPPKGRNSKYVVTALDRLWNESKASNAVNTNNK